MSFSVFSRLTVADQGVTDIITVVAKSSNGPVDGLQPLFGSHAGDGQKTIWRGRRSHARRPGKQAGVDSVIDAVYWGAVSIDKVLEVPAVVFGAGHDEFRQSDFFAQLRRIRGVNILGMSGKAEVQSAELGGKKCHRSRRVRKMGMQNGKPRCRAEGAGPDSRPVENV